MGQLERRLRQIEQSSRAQRAKGKRLFTQSTSDPAVYYGQGRETYTRAEIEALRAEGWQCLTMRVSLGHGQEN